MTKQMKKWLENPVDAPSSGSNFLQKKKKKEAKTTMQAATSGMKRSSLEQTAKP